MSGDDDTTHFEIKATETFVRRGVAKEDAGNQASGEFMRGGGENHRIIETTENVNV